GRGSRDETGREALGSRVEVVHRQADLLEVVRTRHPCRRFTYFLDGGQEQADEDGNDGNHHHQFDQRERATFCSHETVPRVGITSCYYRETLLYRYAEELQEVRSFFLGWQNRLVKPRLQISEIDLGVAAEAALPAPRLTAAVEFSTLA